MISGTSEKFDGVDIKFEKSNCNEIKIYSRRFSIT